MFTKQPVQSIKDRLEGQPFPGSVPLLRYWTWRYVMILLIMLMGIGLFGMYWIRMNTQEQQFQLLEARTALVTDTFSKMLQLKSSMSITPAQLTKSTPSTTTTEGTTPLQSPVISVPAELVPSIPDGYQFQIFDQSGAMIYYFSNAYLEKEVYLEAPPHQIEILTGKKMRDQIDTASGKWLRVSTPFYQNNQITGTLYMTAKYNEDRLSQMYGLIVLSIGFIALCGWAVVFVLSRSLTRPLIQLAHAAKQVSIGNYKPQLPETKQIKESEISGLIQSFNNMTGRLSQLEHMRTDLLAGVSHELRTPVTSIRGMLQAIQEGVVTGDKVTEFMNISLKEAKRLQFMVNDLLDFSSMESGEVHPDKERIEFTSFIEEIMEQMRTIPAFSSISIELEVRPAELSCLSDPAHLKQIVLNLLNNSASASATQIRIAARKENARFILDIADNGKGITADEAPFIFERYYRGTSRRKKKQGLGLGLPICRLLAQANDGTIELLQIASTGTTFQITLLSSE